MALAVVTGLGLFAVGDLRGEGPWAAFALAAAAAFFFVGIWSRSAVGRMDASPSALDPDEDRASARVSSSEVGRIEEASSPNPSRWSNDVDYLIALRHEFRTPLNAVLGFSDVLLSGIDGEVNSSQREDLEIIRASGTRLRILLDSALDLSRLVDGELRLEIERVDVCELILRVSTEAAQLWSTKRTARSTVPGHPCFADVDEARLRRSILVLADFLASSHRDADIEINLVPSHDHSHLAIEITAQHSAGAALDALPTPREVLTSEDAARIRRWPVAVTSEVIAHHGASLYHGNAPSRFLIRLSMEQESSS